MGSEASAEWLAERDTLLSPNQLRIDLQGIRSNQIQTTLARWSSDRGREGARGGGVGRRENSESG